MKNKIILIIIFCSTILSCTKEINYDQIIDSDYGKTLSGNYEMRTFTTTNGVHQSFNDGNFIRITRIDNTHVSVLEDFVLSGDSVYNNMIIEDTGSGYLLTQTYSNAVVTCAINYQTRKILELTITYTNGLKSYVYATKF